MKTKFNAVNTARTNPKLGFQIHLLVFLITTPAIWVIWYLTDTTYPWPLWSTPAWVIGVFFHYLGVYVFNGKEYKTL